MEEYNLHFLIKTFEEHSIEFEKNMKEIEKKCSLFPETKQIPCFNISEALLVLCKEIKRLNEFHGLSKLEN